MSERFADGDDPEPRTMGESLDEALAVVGAGRR